MICVVCGQRIAEGGGPVRLNHAHGPETLDAS